MIGREFWDIAPIFEGKPPKPKQKIVCPACSNDIKLEFTLNMQVGFTEETGSTGLT